MDVGVCNVLPTGVMSTFLIHTVVVITVHLVMVIVALQMIYMEQIQRAPNSLSQKDDEDKTDKIDMQYRMNLNKMTWLAIYMRYSNHKGIMQMTP